MEDDSVRMDCVRKASTILCLVLIDLANFELSRVYIVVSLDFLFNIKEKGKHKL